MVNRMTRHFGISPGLLMVSLAALCPTLAYSALPSAAVDVAAQKADDGVAPPPAAGVSAERESTILALPPIRVGGMLSYQFRRDISEEQKKMQQGLTGTLTAKTNTFIWQPWFAQVGGELSLTLAKDSSEDSNSVLFTSNNSKNLSVTGNAQLSVLSRSRYPFEAHFDRSDNRSSTDLAVADSYVSQRFGFSQQYRRQEGDAMVGWDRTTQSSGGDRRDRQDTLQLNLTHNLDSHRLQVTGNGSWNRHEATGEQAAQANLSVQHSFTPDPSVSLESMGNISRSGFHLQQGDSDTRLLQMSTLAFWRPAEEPYTVTGGVRVFALGGSSSSVGGSAIGTTARSLNANTGLNYDVSKTTRMNALVNLNLANNNGVGNTSSNQAVGVNYQPDTIEFGSLHYSFSSSANASNQTSSGQDSQRQLALQMSHSLGRAFNLDGGSVIRIDSSQSLASVTSSGSSQPVAASGVTAVEEPSTNLRLTHSGTLGWNLARETTSAMVQLSVSDSRSLTGRKDFFQMANFQISSNLQSVWNGTLAGNLTIQATRQSPTPLPVVAGSTISESPNTSFRAVDTTSTGSLTYQTPRLFGIRRLRFVSDLRLNSKALLPVLGSVKDEETAAWENRLDYMIGRTQFRMTTLIAKNSTPKNPLNTSPTAESVTKVNKSIMFSISRSLGSP